VAASTHAFSIRRRPTVTWPCWPCPHTHGLGATSSARRRLARGCDAISPRGLIATLGECPGGGGSSCSLSPLQVGWLCLQAVHPVRVQGGQGRRQRRAIATAPHPTSSTSEQRTGVERQVTVRASFAPLPGKGQTAAVGKGGHQRSPSPGTGSQRPRSPASPTVRQFAHRRPWPSRAQHQ
jgi:hypothetical protein